MSTLVVSTTSILQYCTLPDIPRLPRCALQTTVICEDTNSFRGYGVTVAGIFSGVYSSEAEVLELPTCIYVQITRDKPVEWRSNLHKLNLLIFAAYPNQRISRISVVPARDFPGRELDPLPGGTAKVPRTANGPADIRKLSPFQGSTGSARTLTAPHQLTADWQGFIRMADSYREITRLGKVPGRGALFPSNV